MARSYTGYRKRAYYGARNYYSRGRAYARSRYSSFRGGAKKVNSQLGLYNPGAEYIAGAAVGMTEIDNAVPAPVKIALASLPLRGGIGGKVSRFFRGMLIGDVISHYTGVKIPVGLPGTSSTSSTSNVTGGW